jgi:Flagellar hook capping protein
MINTTYYLCELLLHSNFPDPFNPITTIQYSLPEDGSVNIFIYDVAGRLLKTLVSSSQTSGYKSIQWDGTNNKNEPVAGGIYFYTLEQKELRQTKKMLLLK